MDQWIFNPCISEISNGHFGPVQVWELVSQRWMELHFTSWQEIERFSGGLGRATLKEISEVLPIGYVPWCKVALAQTSYTERSLGQLSAKFGRTDPCEALDLGPLS